MAMENPHVYYIVKSQYKSSIKEPFSIAMLNSQRLFFFTFQRVEPNLAGFCRGKKQYRGMGFITLKPEGYYKGKKNTKQMMIEWVLEESHVVNGVKIDVTQASPV